MISNEKRTWVVRCDVCNGKLAELRQTTTWLSDEPERLTLQAVGNICEKEMFDGETGQFFSPAGPRER